MMRQSAMHLSHDLCTNANCSRHLLPGCYKRRIFFPPVLCRLLPVVTNLPHGDPFFGETMLKAGILDRFGFLLLCFVRRDAYPPKKRCCGKTSRHVPAGSIFSLLSYLPAFNFFLKYFLETPSIAPAALANHFPIVL